MRSVIKTAKTTEEAIQAGLIELGARREDASIEILEEPSKGLFGLIGGKDAVVRISVEDDFKEELLRDLRLPYVDPDKPIERPKKKEKPVEKSFEKPVEQVERKEEPKREPIVEPVKETVEEPVPMQEEQNEIPFEKPVIDDNPFDDEPVKENVQVEKPIEESMDVYLKEEEEFSEVEEPTQEIDIEGEPTIELLKEMIAPIDANASYSAYIRNQNLHITVEGQDEDSIGLLIGRRGDTLDAMQYLLSVASHRKHLPYRKVIVDINGYRKKREEALVRLAQRSAQKVKKSGRNFRLEPMNPYERRIIHAALQKVEGIHTISEGNEPYRRVVIRANRYE